MFTLEEARTFGAMGPDGQILGSCNYGGHQDHVSCHSKSFHWLQKHQRSLFSAEKHTNSSSWFGFSCKPTVFIKKELLCLVVASSTDILSEKVPYWKRLSSWGKEPSKLKLTLNATQNKFENKFTFPRLSQLSKFKCPRFEAFVSRIKKKKEALCESWLAYQTYSVRMAAWGWPAQCNPPLIRVRHNNAMYQIYTMLQWYI